ncbi:Holliday junction branch migration protein RuvA [Motiliproteus sp. SC1-56]|uniref:Holliday junction branch migration protein RuvA n=1 Tax=Motiliproteus sp. SC1-56 TaxID=2799565 RepID=UPI001A8F2C58|nr:Holliday junction branch migration protein RuvA [Motiliproteus sp. SC1-56]
MIGRLRGELIEKQPPQLLLEVQGIAYEVEAPMSTFYQLPEVGQPLSLWTHFVVREDAHLLFGFHTREERELFRVLIKVNGVGPKLALTILSGIEASEFARCVHQDDTAALVRLPGVGKKTAERLIIEMRDKFSDGLPAPALFQPAGEVLAPATADPRQEAESALIALGYKPAQATKAVAAAARTQDGASAENLIRHALKSMV